MKLPERLKQAAHAFLDRHDRRLQYFPSDHVTGLDLRRDLAIVIGRPDPVCLDVGANEGQTIDLLCRTFARPIVHAFEPAAAVADGLLASGLPRGVTVHRQALGRDVGRRVFTTYRRTVLSSFLALGRHAANPFRDEPVAGRETVEVSTVDAFVAANGLGRVDLLKIDTQGFDGEVLAGARDTLAAGDIHAVLVELNFIPMYQEQADPGDLARQLTATGFRLVDYYEKVRLAHALAWCTALFVRTEPAPGAW